jgi:hypothetical protein
MNGSLQISRPLIMTLQNRSSRDVVVVLLTDVCLKWLSAEKDTTVGEMADRFLSLLEQEGFEIVKKTKSVAEQSRQS